MKQMKTGLTARIPMRSSYGSAAGGRLSTSWETQYVGTVAMHYARQRFPKQQVLFFQFVCFYFIFVLFFFAFTLKNILFLLKTCENINSLAIFLGGNTHWNKSFSYWQIFNPHDDQNKSTIKLNSNYIAYLNNKI